MMLSKRIIPILTILDNRLVKTYKFSNPTYIGDPINAIRIFNEKEVDEIVVIDIGATKNNKGVNFNLLKDLAEECFMPLTYGGGINSLEDAKQIFYIGVEKIIIQSEGFNNPTLISELVRIYGSSSIVISIDIVYMNGSYDAFNYLTKSVRKESLNEILNYFLELGIGEFCFNLKNLDGTLSGPDFNFISSHIENLRIPSIYVGGVSSVRDIEVLSKTKIGGIGVGRLFCLYGPHNAPLIRYFKN
jgi:cyclase